MPTDGGNYVCEETTSQLLELRGWIEALTRRVEELEASAFQLMDHEEIILIATSREDRKSKLI